MFVYLEVSDSNAGTACVKGRFLQPFCPVESKPKLHKSKLDSYIWDLASANSYPNRSDYLTDYEHAFACCAVNLPISRTYPNRPKISSHSEIRISKPSYYVEA